MALLKPCDHGMVISTPEWFFIGPLIFLGLELCHSLALLRLVGGVVGIVGQFQAVIIESSFLDYHKHFGIVESFHDHLSHIFVEVLMFNGAHLFCLKIEDVNYDHFYNLLQFMYTDGLQINVNVGTTFNTSLDKIPKAEETKVVASAQASEVKARMDPQAWGSGRSKKKTSLETIKDAMAQYEIGPLISDHA